MSKHKSEELTGALLNAAVALAEGEAEWAKGGFSPSSRWMDAGPIIERERISILPGDAPRTDWCGHKRERIDGCPTFIAVNGPTPLVAAMRCYVVSKLGHEVELP
jgi:hypothetical protein